MKQKKNQQKELLCWFLPEWEIPWIIINVSNRLTDENNSGK
jgi:hypothetical protein